MARLGDYIEQIRGVSYKPEDVCSSTDNDAVAILRANNIQDDGLNFDDLVYVKKSKILDKQYIQKGDIIVCASSGSKSLVGKAAIASEKFPVAFGAFCKVVRPKKLIPSYIGYFFQSPKYRSTISELSGGANINNIRNEHIDELDIVIVSEKEQESIVNQLDVLSNLIFNRKQQLSKLDELIKSRFIELFGDPRNNPNSFNVVSFNDCVEYMGDIGSNGANKVVVDHLDMKDEEDYALMVRFLNFTKNDFTDDVKYISKEAYDFFKKSQIFGGELIICKIGSAGQNYIMPFLNRPVSLGLNQIMVRINDKTIMPYLYQYLNTDYGKQLIDGCINGAVTKSITKTELKKIPVIVPPIDLQKEFAAFVEQTDKSKSEIQKSLEKLETLKKALMQKYFG